ncbi:MFS transporter [Streptomyces prasinus]|uniref:MFS transporter n=1 Tax=Streptomyces prasinus TaxID=67345 RepID=UPI0036B4FFDA
MADPAKAGPAREDSLASALRHRPFVQFWLGAFLASAGGWFQSLAVPFVLLQLTGSAFWVGLATAAQFVPIMVLGPWAGVAADRLDRRRLVMVTQLARSLVALAMCVCWWSGRHDPLLLVGLAALTGCAQGISMPSWQALVNDYVPREALDSAASLNTIQFNLARSLGPAVAGLVLFWVGPAVAFFVSFVMVLVVVVVLLVTEPVNPQLRRARKDRVADGGFREALRYTWGSPGVMTALTVVFLVGSLGMPIFQHVITFAEQMFDSGALGVALLNLGLGAGTLAGVPMLGRMLRIMRRSTVVAIAMCGYGITFAVFGLAPSLLTATLATVGVGVFFLLALSVAQNTIQMLVADRVRGRVLSINVIVYTGSVSLGAAVQGGIGDWLGLRATVLGAAALLVLAAALLAVGSHRLSLRHLNGSRDESYVSVTPEPASSSASSGASTAHERTRTDAS